MSDTPTTLSVNTEKGTVKVHIDSKGNVHVSGAVNVRLSIPIQVPHKKGSVQRLVFGNSASTSKDITPASLTIDLAQHGMFQLNAQVELTTPESFHVSHQIVPANAALCFKTSTGSGCLILTSTDSEGARTDLRHETVTHIDEKT